jgi:hypothetical protein
MLAMESLLGEEQVLSWFDRSITPEFLQELLQAIYLVVVMKSLTCEAKVRSRQTRVTAQKGSNFWSDRWIVLKFLQ